MVGVGALPWSQQFKGHDHPPSLNNRQIPISGNATLMPCFFSEDSGREKMGDEGGAIVGDDDDIIQQRRVLSIYPLSSYFFGSKEAIPIKDQTLDERIQRLKSNYAAYGLRTCVEAVILVELFKYPHLLLLQLRNSVFKLPGGRLRPNESDAEGLKRKLSRKLSLDERSHWEVGECIGMWWRSDFETILYPYLSPSIIEPKECTKIFLVNLPATRKFIVPKNFKLLAVPLHQIREKPETYGPMISAVAQLLSKFSFNIIQT